MALTDAEFDQVRAEIGDTTPPTDAELDTIHDRVGTIGGVVYEVLQKRLANLLSQPSTFAIPGEYSQSTAANITGLRQQLDAWAAYAPGAVTVVGVTRLESRHAR